MEMEMERSEAGHHRRLCRVNMTDVHKLSIEDIVRRAEDRDWDSETVILIFIIEDCSQGDEAGDETGWIPEICLAPSSAAFSTCLMRLKCGNFTIRPVKDGPDGNTSVGASAAGDQTKLEAVSNDYNPAPIAEDGGLFVFYLQPGKGDAPVTVLPDGNSASVSSADSVRLPRVAIQAVRRDGMYSCMNLWLGCQPTEIAGSGGLEGVMQEPAMVALPGDASQHTYVAALSNPLTSWNLCYDGNDSGIFTLHSPFDTNSVLVLPGGLGSHLVLCPERDASGLPPGSSSFTVSQLFP